MANNLSNWSEAALRLVLFNICISWRVGQDLKDGFILSLLEANAQDSVMDRALDLTLTPCNNILERKCRLVEVLAARSVASVAFGCLFVSVKSVPLNTCSGSPSQHAFVRPAETSVLRSMDMRAGVLISSP